MEDGAEPAVAVARELVAFIAEAKASLDVAIYDFQAREGAAAQVADALEAAAARGVAVRVAFNMDRRDPHAPEPPVPRPPIGRPELIDGLDVPTRAIDGNGSLMHHKYVVRDGAAVWTGSTNWTDDAFSREENIVLRVESRELAAAFAANFGGMWQSGSLQASGGGGPESPLGDVVVTPYFSPRGPSLAHVAATRLGEARRRIRVLSPVITSGAVLGTLVERAGRKGFDLAGAYDLTQMEQVQEQWAGVPANHWKIEAWRQIAPRLSGKRSTPFRPGSVHDYMHAKAIVADDQVVTGSYNLSRGGEDNAENLLHIQGGDFADRIAAFADRIAARYREGASRPLANS